MPRWTRARGALWRRRRRSRAACATGVVGASARRSTRCGLRCTPGCTLHATRALITRWQVLYARHCHILGASYPGSAGARCVVPECGGGSFDRVDRPAERGRFLRSAVVPGVYWQTEKIDSPGPFSESPASALKPPPIAALGRGPTRGLTRRTSPGPVAWAVAAPRPTRPWQARGPAQPCAGPLSGRRFPSPAPSRWQVPSPLAPGLARHPTGCRRAGHFPGRVAAADGGWRTVPG
jgi:hypothetical protein